MDDKPKAKLIPVRALAVNQQSALVEWESKTGIRRGSIPTAALDNGKVDATVLEAAIPYGVPWEEVKFRNPTPDSLATALRQAGIWTKKDLFENTRAVVGILQSIYGIDLAALVMFAEQSEKEK